MTKSKPKGGPDGTVVENRRIKTDTQAIATMKVRCRPGTFEWRYGRFGNVQYHAGSTFARLWERAGVASSGGNRMSGVYGSGVQGQPDAQVQALDLVRKISQDIGGPMTRRLVAYCVEGRTPKEIAAACRQQVTDRQVSETLDLDLLELAKTMRYA